MPHPKTRSLLKQDCLEQGLHRWDCGPGGTQLFRALRNKRLFPAVQNGINSEHLCSSAVAVPPCCQWQHFSAEGPRGPAAVLDHCVTSRRNVAGSELGQGLTRKEPFELTHPTPIKQQHDTHICPRLPACIVTGSERQTDGWDQWISGTVGMLLKQHPLPLIDPLLCTWRGKARSLSLSSSCCCCSCYYRELWK